jgi:cell division protein FtsB
MLGLSVFVLFSLWAVLGVLQKERDSRLLKSEAQVKLEELKKREIALHARIGSLETERGQEAALRDAYGVGKDGEAMIQIVDKPADATEERAPDGRSWFANMFPWW